MEPRSIWKFLFFIPIVLSELPLILVGVDFKGFIYVSALIFFTLVVGISEELYFRGIILKLLKHSFSVNHISLVTSTSVYIAIGLQEIIMIVYALYLWNKVSLENVHIDKCVSYGLRV